MNYLIKFFTTPSFPDDEEKNLAARTLHVLHLNMLFATLILGTLGVIFIFREKTITGIVVAIGVLTILAAMILNHRGSVRASGIFLLTALWGVTVFLLYISGGIRSLDLIFFLTGTVIAGITFGANGAFFYAGVSLITGLVFIFLENMGVQFPQLFKFPPFSNWMVLFINLAFTVFPLKIALETLAESNKRYRLIANVISDYAYTVNFDEQGNLQNGLIDGAFENITGYKPDEFFAKGGWRAIVHPEDVQKDEWNMEQLRLNKRVVSDIRIIRKDEAIRWVRSYGHPLWDKKLNRLVGIYGAVQDITEQKFAEAAYLQSANEMTLLYKLSLALSSGQDLYNELRAFVNELKKVMVVDAFHVGFYEEETGIFTYTLFLNDDEDLNIPPRDLKKTPGLTGEVISTKQTVYVPDITDPQAQTKHHIIIVRNVGMRAYLGIPLILEDKAIGVMSVQSKQANAYSQEQIRLLETIAAQVVITSEKSRLLEQLQKELMERQRLLHEMEVKNAELERFSYTVSHDLKTPLVTIRGFLGFMEKSALNGDKEAFQRDMTRVIKATDRMNQLLRDLLELSRIGRVLNEKKETSFESLVYAAIENVQGRLREKNIKPLVQADLPIVFVDQPRMIEALQNLMDNAAKYMGEQKEPQIEIGFDGEQNGGYTFFVRDNGIGIAPEHHE
ncbi:MAG: GAF domain-containing protein, partial [Anaerolineales bacterium]